VRFSRGSLRANVGRGVSGACAVLVLGFGSACGGGAAANATPTATAPATTGAAVAPTAARPALATPVASPSAVASTSATATPTTGAEAGETYEVQSGDTLLSIAEQYYQDSTQWRRIYEANKDTIGADPDKLKIGEKLAIPPKQS
jgi:nucleoid-associated protein YgaU